MRTFNFLGRTTLVLFLCSSSWSQATEFTAVVEAEIAAALAPEIKTAELGAVPENTEPTLISGFGAPLASHELRDFRGGFDVVKNDMQLNGVVANNSASDIATGSNFISSGSFANSTGFPTVVQNSGSNVLIQNATIINLQYQ
jgi:hypothetical protein